LNLDVISIDTRAQLSLDVEIRKEVIDRLRKYTRPVDGVDGAKAMRCIEGSIAEKSFNNILPNIRFNGGAW
jgi:hypothetical protein